jgi:anti-sigma regulatory factor (Ser/Thr protein kinase)
VPYRQCPGCGNTVHSVGGYSAPSACSVCGTALPEDAKRFARDASGVHRRLAREPVAAGAARRVLRGLGGEIEQEVYEVAALLVTELIANSVLHAGPAAGEYLELEVAVMPDRVRVEVRDQGPGFAWRPRPDADPIAFHWGLQLVERLASRWDVEPGNDGADTVVWFELDRASAA